MSHDGIYGSFLKTAFDNVERIRVFFHKRLSQYITLSKMAHDGIYGSFFKTAFDNVERIRAFFHRANDSRCGQREQERHARRGERPPCAQDPGVQKARLPNGLQRNH